MNRFDSKFKSYACHGDEITATINGFDVAAYIVHDQFSHIDDDDCHNPDQSITGCSDKQQKNLLEARQAWLNNEWFYCGVVLEVSKNGVTLDDHAASLWAIECNYPGSNNSYLTEVANELLDEAIEVGQSTLNKLVA